VSACAREQGRVAELVVELGAVEQTAADKINQSVGKVEANLNAGCRRAAMIAKSERRPHRHPRF
jgi:hypothetical protein